MSNKRLQSLITHELALPVDPRVAAMAAALAGLYPDAARAVLFYGSCLRTAELDGLMLDFYLIVSDYEATYGRSWLARANRLVPPNVFPFEHGGLAAKYAVLSEADFRRLNGPETASVSVWARFAQPSRLVWAADEKARENVVASVAEATPTLFRHTIPMLEPEVDHDILAVWKRGFSLTYSAELRAERTDRSASIVDSDPDRYRAFGQAALAATADRMGVGPEGEVANAASPQATARRWRRMRRAGKALSVIRLAKASATYAGGIDYIAWKINRHAGTAIEIKPWQRRWPLLGAITLLPRLLARGAIR